ncbi:hypothetical protein BH23ACT2_BH23ACT2_14750 [soil metagenome]
MISREQARNLDGAEESREALLAIWEADGGPDVEFVAPPADLVRAVAEDLRSLDDEQLQRLIVVATDELDRRPTRP